MTVNDKAIMSEDVLSAYLSSHKGSIGKTSFFQHQVAHYNAKYTMHFKDELPKISVPVQILWGEADEWQPLSYATRLKEDIPNASLQVIKNAGHFIMEDAPDECAQHLIKFCSSL